MIKVNTDIKLIGNKKVTKKIKSLFSKVENTKSLSETFYKHPKSDIKWIRENIGCQCLEINTNKSSFQITSCDHVPIYFLSHLWNILSQTDPDCILEARFKSESNDPIGAFVFVDGIYAINDDDLDPDEDKEYINKRIEELVDKCYEELNKDDYFIIKYRE